MYIHYILTLHGMKHVLYADDFSLKQFPKRTLGTKQTILHDI